MTCLNQVVLVPLPAAGTVLRSFGQPGLRPGDIGGRCEGMRFSPDGDQIIVAELQNHRLSVFSIDGVFLRFIGLGVCASVRSTSIHVCLCACVQMQCKCVCTAYCVCVCACACIYVRVRARVLVGVFGCVSTVCMY